MKKWSLRIQAVAQDTLFLILWLGAQWLVHRAWQLANLEGFDLVVAWTIQIILTIGSLVPIVLDIVTNLVLAWHESTTIIEKQKAVVSGTRSDV
jgi:hypothetical protein